MKDNLGPECVKRGFYPSRAKLKQLPLISLEKRQLFLLLALLFHLLSLKSSFPSEIFCITRGGHKYFTRKAGCRSLNSENFSNFQSPYRLKMTLPLRK